MWFSICISSGGLGLVLNAPFPYPARWLTICGDVLFGIELLLFVVFLGIMISRWVLYPKYALHRLLSDQQELCAYAIIPITLLTIAALVASQISTAWGGYSFTIVAYVLWWISMTMIVLYCVVVISVISYSSQHIARVMIPALFLPIVGVATAAVEAASVCSKAFELSTTLAVPVIVMGYFLLGLSVWMAIILYTVFLHRLMTHGWPASPGAPALAILVSREVAPNLELNTKSKIGRAIWSNCICIPTSRREHREERALCAVQERYVLYRTDGCNVRGHRHVICHAVYGPGIYVVLGRRICHR